MDCSIVAAYVNGTENVFLIVVLLHRIVLEFVEEVLKRRIVGVLQLSENSYIAAVDGFTFGVCDPLRP